MRLSVYKVDQNAERRESALKMLTMQETLISLQAYWSEHGCMVAQPFNTEVGAGTANPATMLRVLGPEPWRVGYVEPSVRPDDARYGENPNRLQTHTQFQVILKPDPGNPQELYLASLVAIGIDIQAHDIRFVEDNWTSPALGAWGLGWEVWLDGLEITQFTYFQQAGGLSLDPVSVEITYGIERIMMALQGVEHFKDITYAPGISYGELFGQAEYEMSRYYLDDADVDVNQRLFSDYASEARRMLGLGLPVPAYVYILKCSHAFNVLDARGAIGTTERARAFGLMRTLTRDAAKLWVQRRGELGFPLGKSHIPITAEMPAELPSISRESTLLFEIGVEELPPSEVSRSAEAVRDSFIERMAAIRLGHGNVTVYATPRRLALKVERVQAKEPDTERTVRGPRAIAAFDSDGAPTRAAAGFARAQGVEVEQLEVIEFDHIQHLVARRTVAGRSAAEILSGVLSGLVTNLRSEKNMRWCDPGMSFGRPVRWLVALLGDTVLPVVVGSLSSGRTTGVLRSSQPPNADIPAADSYEEFLSEKGIVVDASARREIIMTAACELAGSVAGIIDLNSEAALLDELTNMIELPNVILGGFSEKYLELPPQILTTVMKKHQRYLPVRRHGELLPYFISVANGNCDRELVRAGNEAVLRARYEDATFFWHADLKLSLEQHRSALIKLTFEERLGSMRDRSSRISEVASKLAECACLSSKDRLTVARAGELAKFDLASQMVIEFSGLAGTMAREYALRAGEATEVAEALAEMEQPRYAGDGLPASAPGALLALADRFDLLVSLFALDANPTGNSDPFGLRRAAAGVVSILRGFPRIAMITVSVGLEAAARAAEAHGIGVAESALTAAREFAIRRFEQSLLAAGHEHRHVRAVLSLADAPSNAESALIEIESREGDSDFAQLVAALQRARRIVPSDATAAYNPAVLTLPAERRLKDVFEVMRSRLPKDAIALSAFLSASDELAEVINKFFDSVLVMTEDLEMREARLGLLAAINQMADRFLDWSAL